MNMCEKWYRLIEKMPPEDEPVDCITANGDQRVLIFHRNLWWLSDMSMYVYFTPIMWKIKEKH